MLGFGYIEAEGYPHSYPLMSWVPQSYRCRLGATIANVKVSSAVAADLT
jgi:hypothetical protein